MTTQKAMLAFILPCVALFATAMLPMAAHAATWKGGASGTTLRVVSDAADNSRPGWEDAYTSIHAAIAAIPAGSADQGYNTILVASGTYNISETIYVPAGKEWVHIRSIDIDTGEEDPEHTILDGGGATSIMACNEARTFVSGFTFANGYTNCVENQSGSDCRIGAAALTFCSGYQTVSNCIFRGNSSLNTHGTCIGGLDITGHLIVGCTFTNNTQTITHSGKRSRGCAIFMPGSSRPPGYGEEGYEETTIKGCLFDDNRASAEFTYGSLLSTAYSTIEGCTFLTNSFTHTSQNKTTIGGVVFFGNENTVRNCRFASKGISDANNYVLGVVVGVGGPGCVFRDCDFADIECEISKIDNTAIVHLYVANSTQFIGCRFVRNDMSGRIAQVKIDQTTQKTLFRNCLFAGITRPNPGTVVIKQNKCSGKIGVVVENCTFAGNNDTVHTFGNDTASSCTNYLVNSVFTAPVGRPGTLNNATEVVASNCCFKALLDGPNDYCNFIPEDVGGNLRFVDAANGDYRLQCKSPLRERGRMLPWMADGTDLGGGTRVVSVYGVPYSRDASALPDVGCYECALPFPGLIISFR